MVATKLVVILHLVVLASCSKLATRALLIDTLEQQVQNVIDVANQTLESVEGLSDSVLGEVRNLTSELSTSLDSIVANLTTEINEAVDAVKDTGVEATSCVGDSVNTITSLAEDLLQNATDCLLAKHGLVAEAVGNVAQIIESVVNTAVDIKIQIATCKEKALLEDLCILDIKATINIAGLLTTITTAVSEVTTLVTGILGSLDTCTVGVTDALTDEGNKIVQTVLGCVNNLL